jgi:pimeloyl-ACP methyl ester carboxylesterase
MQMNHVTVEGPDGRYDLSFTDWGPRDTGRTVVCVHGLTRNGRDFDDLAAALSAGARVVCPDMVGRGRSGRLADPEQYALPTYVSHMIQLIERLELGEVDWVGTSMGGLIGMGVVAANAGIIRSLLLNDIGPFVPKAGLERINQYLGLDLRFPDVEAIEAYLRNVNAGFGPLTDSQWRHLAVYSALARDDGTLALNYDQRLALPLKREPIEDIELWPVWEQIDCPVLALRGSESDILLAETAAEMAQRGPHARIAEFRGVGHAPALMADDQIEVVRDWLRV